MALLHAGISTFLMAPHVPPDQSALRAAGADVAVLGLPYDSTTITRPGAAHGPRAVRDGSGHYAFGETYHFDYDVRISDHLTLVDCGDVDGVPGNAKRTFERTEAALDEIYEAGCMPALIGGDHGTTIPGVRAYSRHAGGPFGFVMFDTHLDTAPDIDGEDLSHCCPVARALDLPNLDGRNAVIIGAHGAGNPIVELEVAREQGVTVFSVADIDRLGMREVARQALEIATRGTESIYLSVDIDVLDGAYAWGTCGPEIGGITGRELVQGLQVVGAGPIGAFDMVEVAPAYDPSGHTARTGARIVIDVLAAQACRRRDGAGRATTTAQAVEG